MEEAQLGLARFKTGEAEGGAEEAGALNGHAERLFGFLHGLTPRIRPRRRTR